MITMTKLTNFKFTTNFKVKENTFARRYSYYVTVVV